MPVSAEVTPTGALNLVVVQGVTFRISSITVDMDLTGCSVAFDTVGDDAISLTTENAGIVLVGGNPSTLEVFMSAEATEALQQLRHSYALTATFPSGGDTLQLAAGLLTVSAT